MRGFGDAPSSLRFFGRSTELQRVGRRGQGRRPRRAPDRRGRRRGRHRQDQAPRSGTPPARWSVRAPRGGAAHRPGRTEELLPLLSMLGAEQGAAAVLEEVSTLLGRQPRLVAVRRGAGQAGARSSRACRAGCSTRWSRSRRSSPSTTSTGSTTPPSSFFELPVRSSCWRGRRAAHCCIAVAHRPLNPTAIRGRFLDRVRRSDRTALIMPTPLSPGRPDAVHPRARRSRIRAPRSSGSIDRLGGGNPLRTGAAVGLLQSARHTADGRARTTIACSARSCARSTSIDPIVDWVHELDDGLRGASCAAAPRCKRRVLRPGTWPRWAASTMADAADGLDRAHGRRAGAHRRRVLVVLAPAGARRPPPGDRPGRAHRNPSALHRPPPPQRRLDDVRRHPHRPSAPARRRRRPRAANVARACAPPATPPTAQGRGPTRRRFYEAALEIGESSHDAVRTADVDLRLAAADAHYRNHDPVRRPPPARTRSCGRGRILTTASRYSHRRHAAGAPGHDHHHRGAARRPSTSSPWRGARARDGRAPRERSPSSSWPRCCVDGRPDRARGSRRRCGPSSWCPSASAESGADPRVHRPRAGVLRRARPRRRPRRVRRRPSTVAAAADEWYLRSSAEARLCFVAVAEGNLDDRRRHRQRCPGHRGSSITTSPPRRWRAPSGAWWPTSGATSPPATQRRHRGRPGVPAVALPGDGAVPAAGAAPRLISNVDDWTAAQATLDGWSTGTPPEPSSLRRPRRRLYRDGDRSPPSPCVPPAGR